MVPRKIHLGRRSIPVSVGCECIICTYVCMVTHIARVWINRVRLPILLVINFFFFLFSLISFIADGPHYYHPACGHKGSSHLSPVHALQFFIAMQVQHSWTYNSSTNGWIFSWTKKIIISLSAFAPDNLVSRDEFGSPVPRQPAHLHTQADSGAYLRDSSRVPRRRTFMKPPYAIVSVPSLSGHAIEYRWRSLPRVHRPGVNNTGMKSACWKYRRCMKKEPVMSFCITPRVKTFPGHRYNIWWDVSCSTEADHPWALSPMDGVTTDDVRLIWLRETSLLLAHKNKAVPYNTGIYQ